MFLSEGQMKNYKDNNMKNISNSISTLIAASVLLISFSGSTTIIVGGSYGISSNFVNDGIITTETRSDGTIWEWLDLTITNGLSLNSVELDLADDGLLNNSSNVLLYDSTSALGDVTSLHSLLKSGWSTVSIDVLADLVSSFYGQIFVPYDSSTFSESTLTDDFVELFGDTYFEGLDDRNGSSFEVDSNYRGRTEGFSNTELLGTGTSFDGRFWTSMVYDSETPSSTSTVDVVNHGRASVPTNPDSDIGIWLAREVVAVSEPSTIAIFVLGMIGLASRRFKKQS